MTRSHLINVALEMLVKEGLEIPAFSTLDRLAGHVRTQVNAAYFTHVTKRLTDQMRAHLDGLLVANPNTGRSLLYRIKDLPAHATISHLDAWLDRLSWLQAQADTWQLLTDIPAVRLRHFAAEALYLRGDDGQSSLEPHAARPSLR